MHALALTALLFEVGRPTKPEPPRVEQQSKILGNQTKAAK